MEKELLEMKRKMLCAEIEMNGMKAENIQRSIMRDSLSYGEDAFYCLISKYNLDNSIMEANKMEDFTNGIQKNFCFLAQKECVYCNNLGKCELTGYCYYKTSPPSYGTTTTPNEIIFVKAPDVLPEVLIINGERYIKEHKI